MTDARTKAVEAMLELLPHREVVEAFWDEAYTHGCTDEARRWIAGEGDEPANDYIDIVFDGPPAHESGRFVETEDSKGRGISAGEWVERDDGYWVLRIPRYSLETEAGRYKVALEELLHEQDWYGRDCGCGHKSYRESNRCPQCSAPRGSPTADEYVALLRAEGDGQADTQGNDLPDTEPATPDPRMAAAYRLAITAMDYFEKDDDEFVENFAKDILAQLPSVPQPGEGEDAD